MVLEIDSRDKIPTLMLSKICLELPKGTRASTPLEARTVVLLKWDCEYAFSYGQDGYPGRAVGEAYRVVGQLSIYDKSSRQMWCNQKTITGSPPEKKIKVKVGEHAVRFGCPPIQEFTDYINSLPRK